jgi:putative endonuclease
VITVYALKSLSRNYVYIGMTSELDIRLTRHNEGKNRTTKAYAPFEMIHTREFENRIEARVYEKFLKTGVGRKFLKGL